MSRIDGYLSREIIVRNLTGKEEIYNLHILKIGEEESSRQERNDSSFINRLVKNFEIIPYSHEIPFIVYSDKEIEIIEIEKGLFKINSR